MAVPSTEELAVVGGLVSAIMVATGQKGDASSFGLVTPTDVAQGFSSIDVDVQTEILGVLDAIERAPAAGLFSSLSDAQRQAFIRQTLSMLQVSVPPDPAFEQQLTAVYATFIDQVTSGTLPSETEGIASQFLDSDPPDPAVDVTVPPDGPPVPADVKLSPSVPTPRAQMATEQPSQPRNSGTECLMTAPAIVVAATPPAELLDMSARFHARERGRTPPTAQLT